MKRSSLSIATFCVTLIFFAASTTYAVEAVVNGGFESGSFSSWTVADSSNFTNIGSNPLFAHSGNFHANLGATGVIGSLSQLLNTTVGTAYTVSFWLANDSGVPPNFFQALFNGVALVTLNNASTFPYQNFTFTNLTATSPTTQLVFRYQNDADFFRLDDVSVTGASIPEANSALLAVLGLGGLFLFRNRFGRVQKGSHS